MGQVNGGMGTSVCARSDMANQAVLTASRRCLALRGNTNTTQTFASLLRGSQGMDTQASRFLQCWGFCKGAVDYRHPRPLCSGSEHVSEGLQTTGPLGSGPVSTSASLISNSRECVKCLDRGGHIWVHSWDQ